MKLLRILWASLVALSVARAAERGMPPNYWCTWSLQNYSHPEFSSEAPDALIFAGEQGARLARHHLTEEIVFGPRGWARTHFPEDLRKGLFLVLDDGWDVPFGLHPKDASHRFGSLIVDENRFPSCTGAPAERLKKLNQLAKDAGWRGIGLWVACQNARQSATERPLSKDEARAYWRERAAWSRDAGIEYWKVDWGDESGSLEYRRLMTEVGREIYPALIIEHALPQAPLNDWKDDGRLDPSAFSRGGQLLDFSAVLRTYDVTWQLSLPTTIDRVVMLLRPRVDASPQGLLNCEDEVYVGAVLGCALGVMRSPLWRGVAGYDYDPFRLRKRWTEVERALRWQQLAPPWPVDREETLAISPEVNADTWTFGKSDTWFSPVIGQPIRQAAPATVARRLALPLVKRLEKETPYVVAARHPGGAVSLAALPRVGADRQLHTPSANISLLLSELPPHLAVFGRVHELIVKVALPPVDGGRWRARDLAAPHAPWVELGAVRVPEEPATWKFSGEQLQRLGSAAQPAGDESQPGVLLEFAP